MVMKKTIILFFCILSVLFVPVSGFASSVQYIDGSLDRVYETKSGEWTAFVLVKDSFRKSFKCLVHPDHTLIKKGSQILSLADLNPGTKVIIIARPGSGEDFKASVIQVKDPVLR